MADQLLKSAQDLLEGQIDFEGQKLTEIISTVLLAATGFFAFIIGYLQQNVYLTLWVGLGGSVLTLLMVVPPWPAFNESPEPWLPARHGTAGMHIEVDGKKIK